MLSFILVIYFRISMLFLYLLKSCFSMNLKIILFSNFIFAFIYFSYLFYFYLFLCKNWFFTWEKHFKNLFSLTFVFAKNLMNFSLFTESYFSMNLKNIFYFSNFSLFSFILFFSYQAWSWIYKKLFYFYILLHFLC